MTKVPSYHLNQHIPTEVRDALRKWAFEKDMPQSKLVVWIFESVLRNAGRLASAAAVPPPPQKPKIEPATPEEQEELDRLHRTTVDTYTLEEVREMRAHRAASAGAPPRWSPPEEWIPTGPATPEEQAELNSLNAGSDVPITVEELREMKAVAVRNKVV